MLMFLGFQISRFPDFQISGFPDFQTPVPPAALDELSDPNLSPLPRHPLRDQILCKEPRALAATFVGLRNLKSGTKFLKTYFRINALRNRIPMPRNTMSAEPFTGWYFASWSCCAVLC